MHIAWPLYAVGSDGTPFALIRTIDAVEAVDLAFDLYTARWSGAGLPAIAAAEHRPRLVARPASNAEAELFAARSLTGEARLAAVSA
jgi:hypothetical protein